VNNYPRHFNLLPTPARQALVQLLVEDGYLTNAGYLTPLGEQYIDAMALDAAPTPPNRLDPSGGKDWSEVPDF
jgi:hypothetical protein